ncbi:MAG: LL-diaminopimelate aminotransferase [Vulcanimicrobiota bacterium]
MKFSRRLEKIPPYLFAELDRMKREKIQEGVDVISLGVGDPDLPTAELVVRAMQKAVQKAEHHDYPPYDGTLEFKKSMADFYRKRFDADIDPKDEIIALIGSKEGIAHLTMAVLDPGDILLVPDPGYPVYKISAFFAGADVYKMPLLAKNSFLPDFSKIPEDVAKKAKMMYLNYPNNPTAAVATKEFYEEAVQFAKTFEIIIASDNAYSEIFFREPPVSILSVSGAKDIAGEFFSLSKPYNMTGWRVGAFLGNRELVNALATFKKNLDSGTFTAVQEAAGIALMQGDSFVRKMRDIYKTRRDKMLEGLDSLGIKIEPASATFYIWAPTPNGMGSMEFTKKLLDETGILVSPGVGFGDYGEGFFRISLTTSDEKIDEALSRMKNMSESVLA